MARIRKTASIASILKRTNYKLLHSTCSPDVRRGMADVLSVILMDAGLYAGYGYITHKQLVDADNWSEKAGIVYYDGRSTMEVEPNVYFDELTERRERGLPADGGRYKKEYPDESRRFYYVANAIHVEYRKLGKDGENA